MKNKWNVISFSGAIEPHVLSFLNSAAIIKSNTGYNILFEQKLSGKKNGIGYIPIVSGNKYTYSHLILTHLNYHLLLNNTVQTAPNEIIAPLAYRNKMIFVRIKLN